MLQLRGYQQPMADHLLTVPRNGLWAGMGTGKTLTCLYAINLMQYVERDKTLVLAPKRVAESTWPDEARKWSHLLPNIRVQSVSGAAAQRLRALEVDANVFTITYELIPWLIFQMGAKWPFARIIPDESTRLKNIRVSIRTSKLGKKFVNGQGGTRARSIAKIAHTPAIKYWWNLTGTPSPNGYLDLWGQTWFVDAGLRLGHTFGDYQKRYFMNTAQGLQRPTWGLQPYGEQHIRAKLADVTLALEANDHFKLPPLISNTIYVDMPAAARKQYRAMETAMYAEIKGTPIEAFTAGARTQKLLQMASGAVYENAELGAAPTLKKKWKEIHDGKTQVLDSIIAEAAGMPILVAYYFVSDLERLQMAFPKGRVLDADPRTISEWNAGKIPILFAHPKSAGHGLNLQDGGNILVFFSHDWNLEEYLQIIERIGPTRQAQSGHNRPVYVHYIVARGTVDEDVIARRDTKASVQATLMESMKRRTA